MGYFKCLLTLLLITTTVVHSFNIDSKTNLLQYNITSPDTNTQFGFSMKFFNSKGYRLIIGAPYAQNRSGAVYDCPIKGSCSLLDRPEDLRLPDHVGSNGTAEQLGRSISVTTESVTACAPMWNDNRFVKLSNRSPLHGRCQTFDKTLGYKSYESACRAIVGRLRSSSNIHGYCALGFTSQSFLGSNKDIYRLETTLGSWRWRGGLVATKNGKRISHFTNLVGEPRAVKVEKITDTNFTDIQSLLGYDTCKGNFSKVGIQGLAAGAPRSNAMCGQVMVYAFELQNKTGFDASKFSLLSVIDNPEKTIGQYFGASVAAIDFNGDGYDDLAVGVPMYTSSDGNLRGFDEGKVYIFRNTKQGTLFVREPFNLTGVNRKGARFGSTVKNIGDINGDGTDDLAIGAPFGGPDGKGSVFIYNVRNNTIVDEPSQIINSPGGSAFGLSIEAQIIDTRIYPALAVGAPESGQVYLFRAKTIITLKDTLWVSITRVPPEASKSNCEKNGKKYHCIEFRTTLEDISTNPPDNFEVKFTTRLDTTSLGFGKRAFIIDPVTNTLVQSLTEDVAFKIREVVILSKMIYFSTEKTTDFGSAITITTDYKIIDTKSSCEDGLCAILDQFGAIGGNINVKYLRKCGQDDICDVDLAIEKSSTGVPGSKTPDTLRLGSFFEEVVVNATVTNYNESAYLARMIMRFHPDFELIQIQVNKRNVEADTSPHNIQNNNETKEIQFLLANPISEREKILVEVRFKIGSKLLAPSKEIYSFDMEVTSSGNDYNPTNNKRTATIKAGIESCIRIQLGGKVKNSVLPLYYDHTKEVVKVPKSINDVGPSLGYNFLVQNSGRKDLHNLTVELHIIDKYNLKKSNQEKEVINVVYVYELTGNQFATCDTRGVNTGNFHVAVNKTNSRKRRDTQYIPKLNCLNGICNTYKCRINTIKPGELAEIKISIAVYLHALVDLKSEELTIEAEVKFGGTHGDLIKQKTLGCNDKIKLTQPIQRIGEKKVKVEKKVEWWIILVAVVGALIILAIFCAILYRIGFFKRNRVEEATPLEGNHVEKYERNSDDDQ